jgi:hypothetical protein
MHEPEVLLAEGVEDARIRERNAFDEIVRGSSGDIVLSGAGGLGRRTLAGLRKHGITPLAICCYHRQDHLWKIPLFIHSHSAGYRFHLGPHDREMRDLVCYAVPPHRAPANRAVPSVVQHGEPEPSSGRWHFNCEPGPALSTQSIAAIPLAAPAQWRPHQGPGHGVRLHAR